MKRLNQLHNLVIFLAMATALVVGSWQPAFAERKGGSDERSTVPSTGATGAAGAAAGAPFGGEIDAAITALANDPMFDGMTVDWTGMLDHYAQSAAAPHFTTATGFSGLGSGLRERIGAAVAAGLALPPTVVAAVAALQVPASVTDQARAEALLAAVFVGGSVDAVTYLGERDLRGAGILDSLSEDGVVKVVLDRQFPTYYRFWSLLDYLPRQLALYRAGGWTEVPAVKKLEPGKTDPAVPDIRARLIISGELAAADSASGNLYDARLVEAVEAFQRSHGLNDDGIIGGRTIEELNISADKRVRQILLNLERMRDEGPSFQARHLIANIPSQEVKVIEDGKVTFYTKAIFGKLERKSPTLSSEIHTVKLNPDWTAPAKIAAIDEVKRERANPGFLDAKGFTIYDGSGRVVSPSSIDWHSVGPGNFPYTLRQAPGPENALGPVKFDFPNDHAVFLHGTPTVKLFDEQDRFFSSGCVRTQRPVELAKFLLDDDPEWPAERIDEVLKSGKTTLVRLKRELPIHITYMTAWVDEDGVMQFRKDAYGYDRLPSLPGEMSQLMVAEKVPELTAQAIRKENKK